MDQEERVARFVGLHEEDVPSSKEFLGWCTFAVLAANAVEGLAAVYLARTKFLFSRRNCLGWFLLSLVAGRAAHREVFFFRRGGAGPPGGGGGAGGGVAAPRGGGCGGGEGRGGAGSPKAGPKPGARGGGHGRTTEGLNV